MSSSQALTSQFLDLHRTLTRLGFNEWNTIRECDVVDGSPHVYAAFLRFIYSRFPLSTSELLRSRPWFVVEANDTCLGATTIRVLSDVYDRGAPISGLQFAKKQFASAKLTICLELIRLLRGNEEKLVAQRKVRSRVHERCAAGSDGGGKRRNPDARTLADEEHAVVHAYRSQLNALPRS